MSDDIFRWVIAAAVGLATLSIVVQAIVVLILFKTVKRTEEKVVSLAAKVEPVIENVRRLIDENGPKISAISTEAVVIVKMAKEQVHRVGEFLKDFTDRAKAQIARIDGAVDETVDQVQHASAAAKSAVLKPVREVNGLWSGLRTAISVYTQGRRASVDHATQDEEMFI
jgi:hypothetical protein